MLTSIRYFRDEYLAHIVDHKCPAGVCLDLITYRIDADICNGCTLEVQAHECLKDMGYDGLIAISFVNRTRFHGLPSGPQ